MFKKLVKVAIAITLLIGCYVGYLRLFATVVDLLREDQRTTNILFAVQDSTSKKQSIAYARASFGRNHWSAADDLGYRYYNAERGFWMYAKEYERVVVDSQTGIRYDGKRIKLKPFALITKSHDGKNTKTITADLAIFDLTEPLGFTATTSDEPLKVKHARLEQNVCGRDDKNTPDVLEDDMKVGPVTVVEYDDPTRLIHTQSHVVIQDLEMVTTGDGMTIHLFQNDIPHASGPSATGFSGAEKLELLKNVHVILRDVGKSGLMPAASSNRQSKSSKVETTAETTVVVDAKSAPTAEPVVPTPLDIRCDAKMQVNLPKPVLPVAVGPPAPPGPTIVQFERNVVVLRGQLDDQPDQMTCDTLKLRMVPGDKSTEPSSPAAKSVDSANLAAEPADNDNSGLFGGLTLQRAYATGHVVWLHLPKQGIKLRCNELSHERRAPRAPDVTYFRGDATRPLEIEKVDMAYDEDDELDPGTITSVTNIWTIDATLFDNGTGTDTANVVAHGPGRLETRPDRDQPVEKIAIWQDKFILQNDLSPEGQVLHKIIDLTGNRPCFIDKAQGTRLDSAQLIKVTLKPKTDGGGLRIERLFAVQDVHLIAPPKTMNATQKLYAEFFEVETTQPNLTASLTSPTIPNAPLAAPGASPDQQPTANQPETDPEAVAAQTQEEKKSPEPAMTGTAERIYAKVALRPKPVVDEKAKQPATSTELAVSSEPSTRSALKSKTTPKQPGTSDTDADIQIAWLFGNVSLHQEPAEGKTKGQSAAGEALYLDNRGRGKAITHVYQRDPTETTPLPGPLPPAWVENETMEITAVGVLKVNQGTDEAWVQGPGTLTQMADRGFFTDKSGENEDTDRQAADDLASSNELADQDRLPVATLSTVDGTESKITTRTTAMTMESNRQLATDPVVGMNAQHEGDTDIDHDAPADDDAPVRPKTKTRAGRPVTEKAPMTISFTDGMDFTGRTTDPEGRPAARANFYGVVTAQMEDALLYGEEKMIAYTDKVVPLAQLGEMSKAQSKPRAANQNTEQRDSDSQADADPQIALIFSYQNAIAISRKVDPDSPQVIQQQRIEADDILAYDRRTGDFQVPGKGIVYLYDRSTDSASSPVPGAPSASDVAGSKKVHDQTTGKIVTPTSDRVAVHPDQETGSLSKRGSKSIKHDDSGAKKAADVGPGDELPPLVLTQIHFVSGMRGRFGTGKENDKTDTRWAEFFNNVEALRAKVANTYTRLDRDRLPPDGFFLTGQTLRVITEPPPVGAPASTPARNYLKAWENAYVSSNDKTVEGDVVTYDSYKDLIYVYGENGRGVIYAQQHVAGQPTSPGSAEAVQINPKTGAMHLINSNTVQMIDKDTGIRPSPALAPDPYAKKKKTVKRPYRLPTGNMERRGFTGQ